ncbi:16S rRNA (cytosine(1402)-N(4))-methyltransferase RsmH [uncultured Alloprevotella sp.]|uniref:16S rRNA (cytosine(1402)-N(4))-methyltransferase RsmH n=1 Tax=uncultured Alloprevotella sp. TaxID=1283315 RepID=UPI0026056D00|nr:16S rRNA (cytosine(1402)-N(4))-methyltransferase RsmH [uncultured Alloprevotella sp.]
MTDAAPDYHIPVLLQATVDGLNVRPDGCYVDCTFGGGGHSREILRRLGPDGRLLAFDQDADAQRNIPAGEDRLTFVQSNFRYLPNWLHYYGYEQVDGILADLGVSSHHFDAADRGFSFRFEGALDMRMNKRAHTSAAGVVNTYSEEQLANLFYLYGELNNGRRLAAAIVKARAAAQIARVEQLVDIVTPYLSAARAKKDMAKVFQALRIEVNHEMEALEAMLTAALTLLKPGGRLSVLTYHSLEDRLVKNFIKAGNAAGKVEQDFYGNRLAPMKPLNGRVIRPDEAEMAANPRSRSAKLRIGLCTAEQTDGK